MVAERSPIVVFPWGVDARAEAELPDKGRLSGVIVEFGGGLKYSLTFYDPVRLGQDLAEEVETGRSFLAEPGLVVLPALTREAIIRAVDELFREGFFRELMPRIDVDFTGTPPLLVTWPEQGAGPAIFSTRPSSPASA